MNEKPSLFGDALPMPKVRNSSDLSSTQQWRPSSKAERQEFFLPVSGFVWFYPEEMRIIDHPAFQRLGLVNQLGQSYYVYRGATHKRFEHVLGVVGVVQEMISAVKNTSQKGAFRQDRTFAPELTESEKRFVRLGALLHDIGHIAAGHTLEDELEIIGKHDADKRITLVFQKTNWDGSEIQSLGEIIDNHFKNYIPLGLKEKLSAQMIARLLIRKPSKLKVDPFANEQTILENSSEIRYDLCSNMIGNTICADLLDYIYRDWYHIGKTRSQDNRIFQYMELRRQANGRMPDPSEDFGDNERAPTDKYVIALGGHSKIRSDGVSSILGLLEWRYELAEAVLFHRTKVSAGAMLDRALFVLWGATSEDDLLDKILNVSDDQLLDVALKESHSTLKGDDGEIAKKLLTRLQARKIYSTLATFDRYILTPQEVDKADQLFRGATDHKQAARNRNDTARNLEIDFDLPTGCIAIYCLSVSAKLAQVSVAIDGEISRLVDYEKRNDDRLSGGHLSAQVKRFDRLWRIHFFIDEDVLSQIGEERADEIRQFIKEALLSVDSMSSLMRVVERFAYTRQAKLATAGNNSVRVKKGVVEFAKGLPGVATPPVYPNRVHCLRNFFEQDS